MFVGHFGLGFAGKRVAPSVSLGTLFLAVEFADGLWPILLLAGVEHARIVPGLMKTNALDLYDYPWSHSLAALVVWGRSWAPPISRRAAAVADHGSWRRHRRATGFSTCACTPVPDMPLLPQGPFVGLSLELGAGHAAGRRRSLRLGRRAVPEVHAAARPHGHDLPLGAGSLRPRALARGDFRTCASG